MGASDGRIVGTVKYVDNGPPAKRWNLVILSEGYTESEMEKYRADVKAVVGNFRATPPFDELWPRINVYRVDVISDESGADDPVATGGTGAVRATFFDATFGSNGQRKLLVVDNLTAMDVARQQVPQYRQALVIVNSSIYGGSGGAVAVCSTAPEASEIALHETGHSAFRLADEYAGCNTSNNNFPGSSLAYPNVTTDPLATGRWADLILSATTKPTTRNPNCGQCDTQLSPTSQGTIGTFEGAYNYHCGVFRPEFDCKMRALNKPFCAVCRREISNRLLAVTEP